MPRFGHHVWSRLTTNVLLRDCDTSDLRHSRVCRLLLSQKLTPHQIRWQSAKSRKCKVTQVQATAGPEACGSPGASLLHSTCRGRRRRQRTSRCRRRTWTRMGCTPAASYHPTPAQQVRAKIGMTRACSFCTAARMSRYATIGCPDSSAAQGDIGSCGVQAGSSEGAVVRGGVRPPDPYQLGTRDGAPYVCLQQHCRVCEGQPAKGPTALQRLEG